LWNGLWVRCCKLFSYLDVRQLLFVIEKLQQLELFYSWEKTTFVCNDSSISLLSHLFHLTISKKNPSSSRTCQSQVANQKCTGVYVGFHLRTATSSFYLVCSYVVVVPWKLNTTEKRLHSWTCKTISILFFLCICAEIIGSQERKLKGVMHGTICFQYSRA